MLTLVFLLKLLFLTLISLVIKGLHLLLYIYVFLDLVVYANVLIDLFEKVRIRVEHEFAAGGAGSFLLLLFFIFRNWINLLLVGMMLTILRLLVVLVLGLA
jgi:hypothetical protein